MGISYATVEDVKTAIDVKASAYEDRRIRRALESASRSVEGQMNRRFYPQVDTRYFDWPTQQHSWPQTLWLQQHEVISITTLTAGGTTISASSYNLEPNGDGPPFNRIELKLSSSASFGGGASHQQNIAVTGVFGYGNETEAAGALAEALDDSETGVDVTDSSLIGVGDTVLVDSEYMLVTGKSMLDTAVDIHASDSLTASASDVAITCSTTTAIPQVGETILIDSERMLVVDLAGSVLTVKRAWDGSALAAHAAGASIYAPRTLTVTRAALGTTAATHLISATVYRHVVPGLIRDLTIAEAIVRYEQETAGYARTVGSGDNVRNASMSGLNDLRAQAYAEYGRKARKRSV